MTPTQHQNIFKFKTSEDNSIAFHVDRLEVASISEEAFNSDLDFEEFFQWNIQSNENQSPLPTETPSINKLVINNTQICNLKCNYCAAGGDGTFGDPVVKISVAKTLPQIEFYINKLNFGESFYINFMGGEPLLEPLTLKAIYDFAFEKCVEKNIDLQIVITTNGTLINSETLAVLNHIKASINVSLDGPPEINDQRRSSKNKSSSSVTSSIILGLEQLTKAKNNKNGISGVGLTAVFDRYYTDVLRTYQYFQSLDFKLDWYEFNFSHTEQDSNASLDFQASLSQTAKSAFSNGGEKELLKIRAFSILFSKLDEQIKTVSYCGINRTLAVLDARNNLHNCPWNIGISKEIFKKEESNLNCSKCWAKNLCGGGCEFIHNQNSKKIATFSNLSHKSNQPIPYLLDKNFCERTQSLIRDAIMFYEACRKG